VVAAGAAGAAAAGAAGAAAGGGSRVMNRGFTGGKRNREAARDLKKKEKEERLRRNRELRARGIDPDVSDMPEAPLPEVKLEDIVIGVPSRPRREDFGPVKLFVGGLSAETTTADLRAAFQKLGELVDVAVVTERATNQSRGFGFVTFASSTAADAAIKQMNGVELDGRTIRVNRAEEQRR
jgi:RNA recognition motif-containing protein